MSLFGAHTGVMESVSLPLVPEADRREVLGWERELIGMYVSEHPLTAYMNEIRRVVTHFSGTLGEAQHEEPVRVAGMVSGIRPHQTKTGKMMAWVTLEDLQGIIELVVFPRTWERFQFALEVGGVIIAEGKVDAQSTPPKVLVDNIRTQIKLTEPAQLPLQPQRSAPERKPVTRTRVAEPAATYRKTSPPKGGMGGGARDEPPPPEDPPDWETYVEAAPVFSIPDLVIHDLDLPEEQPLAVSDQTLAVGGQPLAEQRIQSEDQSSIVNQQSPIEPLSPAILPPVRVLPDVQISTLIADHAPQMVTVLLRPSGDGGRDIRRISRLHGTFISYPGKDHFAFQIFEEGRGHLIEFPNDTTGVCAELLAKIKDTVGEENIRVEPITYQ